LPKDVYALGDEKGSYVIYNKSAQPITIPAMQGKRKWQVWRINPQTGKSEMIISKASVSKPLQIIKKDKVMK
jgi:hypothetical protein